MSEPHGCNDDTAVVETFKEALKQRVGAELYQMWFTHGVDFQVGGIRVVDGNQTVGDDAQSSVVMVRVRGQFALDRIKNNMLRELRGAAMQACGCVDVKLCLDQPVAQQSELPLPGLTERPPVGRRRTKRSTRGRGKTKSLSSLVAGGAGDVKRQTTQPAVAARQLELPNLSGAGPVATDSCESGDTAPAKAIIAEQTFGNFVRGPSNQLAHTAMTMVCQDPRTASPLFVCGPTGTGKSHILAAIADQFRRRHRMRRVMLLSAEQFTNDFISSVGSSGIAAFRRRYREVDALLIDGMQFLGAKKATLREMLYTVETVVSSGRPLISSGIQAPTEIEGLSSELAGRLAAGLVCPIQPLDMATRDQLLRREIEQRCRLAMPEATVEQISATLSGDGRVIQGVANLTNTLQRMFGRVPTMEELRHFGGDLLRSSQPVATLSVIESAVCKAFQLPEDTLRGGAQTRAVTEPRMLAMYLSRQLTSSAYTEIARHFGGRSHSTAISAEKNVKKWLENQKSIGRGMAAMSAQEAIDRVELRLRTG